MCNHKDITFYKCKAVLFYSVIIVRTTLKGFYNKDNIIYVRTIKTLKSCSINVSIETNNKAPSFYYLCHYATIENL